MKTNKPFDSSRGVSMWSTSLIRGLVSEVLPIQSSSSMFSDLIGASSSLSPKDPVAVLFSFEPDPSTSLIRPEDSAIRRRRAFSSAVETLARCFFSGLPRNPSTASALAGGFSGVSVSVFIFGGVMDRSMAGGVVPVPGVLAEVSALIEAGSAECWRLSCGIVSTCMLTTVDLHLRESCEHPLPALLGA